jgi:dTDP-4-amino-4,6-dideoxygalactose transaminase
MNSTVDLFEKTIADWFGAPYGVAVDCCTHGIELCLRYTNASSILVPHNTYLSIPMLAEKLNIKRTWQYLEWVDYYYVSNNVIDAAVLWKKGSYIPNNFMVLSFQFKKHLNLGRGGMILTDDIKAANILKSMSYDGRDLNSNLAWTEQDIYNTGYHYYMTPETAELGLIKIPSAFETKARQWSYLDYPNLTNFMVFKNG